MSHIQTILPQISSLTAYDYQTISNPQTEALISSFLPEPPKFSSLEAPLFIHVSGIPGSGKTTYIDHNMRKNTVRIQFDAIMKQLPGYAESVQKEGLAKAFEKFEMPARVIGYELLDRALRRRCNIVFEHSLNPVHLDLYRYLNDNGYETNLVFMDCSPEEALQRVKERESRIGRHTPEDFIFGRYKTAQQLLPTFKDIAQSFTILSHPDAPAGHLSR